MSDANIIDVSDDNIFTVRTFHGTSVFVNENLYIRHKKISDISAPDRLLYAQLTDTTVSFFIINNNGISYISAITNGGKVLLTKEPCKVSRVYNVLDESIAVTQNGQYWSARKNTGAFDLVNRNLDWEHMFFNKVNSIETPAINVVLLAFNENFLDRTLARLNDKVDIAAALLEGIDDVIAKKLTETKKIPIVPFSNLNKLLINKRDSLWLLCGCKQNPDELKGIAEYFQSKGIELTNIINVFPKMNVDPIWLANIKQAATDECDFIVTGAMRAACGIDVDKIVGQKGVNLAAEGQDLHQSYLIGRYILERNNTIKFVVMALTPEDFHIDDDKYFSDCSRHCRYIFDGDCSTIGDKMFRVMLNDNFEFPFAAVQPDPNLLELKKSGNGIYSISDFKTDSDIEINDRALQQLEDYVQLCFEHKVKPVVVLLPSIKEFYSSEKINLLRRVLKYSQKTLDFIFVDLFEVPLKAEHFAAADRLNMKGAATVSSLLNAKLRIEGTCPIEELRTMTYDQLQSLRGLLGKYKYNDMMNRIFAASIDVIKKKDKIKIGFVVYDPAMWCGDLLYQMFERNGRYEPTLFLCLRMDEKSTLIEEVYRNGLEMFKTKGIRVVGIRSHNVAIPKQDAFIYLTPYFEHLPRALRPSRITAETLITYIPYGFRTTYWNISKFNINFIAWKLFMDSKTLVNFISRNRDIHSARLVYSGLPKMDTIYLDQQNPEHKSEVEWKMTQPDAIKIIWAPHWSIKGFTYHTLSTFQWNYNFMYEYAAAHPETSWIVKPHPQLLHSAVSSKLFPSTEAFKEYLNKWDELPNARVVTGGYYQDIFETSDAMILDSGSFIAEYQFTHKPMLFLTRQGARFSELGNAIIAANYHVDGKDFDGIKNFIEEVLIKKNDTQLETRNKVFDEELNYLKDNGMLASEKIFRTIDDAFQS